MKSARRKITAILRGDSARGKQVLRFDAMANTVPGPIASIIDWLRQNALTVTGLFRLSASFADVQDMMRRVHDASLDLTPVTVESAHVVAGVLKLWLCELSDPLLTNELFEAWMEAVRSPTLDLRLHRISSAVGLLPPGHRAVLLELLSLLVELHENRESNRMAAHNLAIVFAPALLRSNTADLQQLLAQSEACNRLLMLMIELYDVLFEGAELSDEQRTRFSQPNPVNKQGAAAATAPAAAIAAGAPGAAGGAPTAAAATDATSDAGQQAAGATNTNSSSSASTSPSKAEGVAQRRRREGRWDARRRFSMAGIDLKSEDDSEFAALLRQGSRRLATTLLVQASDRERFMNNVQEEEARAKSQGEAQERRRLSQDASGKNPAESASGDDSTSPEALSAGAALNSKATASSNLAAAGSGGAQGDDDATLSPAEMLAMLPADVQARIERLAEIDPYASASTQILRELYRTTGLTPTPVDAIGHDDAAWMSQLRAIVMAGRDLGTLAKAGPDQSAALALATCKVLQAVRGSLAMLADEETWRDVRQRAVDVCVAGLQLMDASDQAMMADTAGDEREALLIKAASCRDELCRKDMVDLVMCVKKASRGRRASLAEAEAHREQLAATQSEQAEKACVERSARLREVRAATAAAAAEAAAAQAQSASATGEATPLALAKVGEDGTDNKDAGQDKGADVVLVGPGGLALPKLEINKTTGELAELLMSGRVEDAQKFVVSHTPRTQRDKMALKSAVRRSTARSRRESTHSPGRQAVQSARVSGSSAEGDADGGGANSGTSVGAGAGAGARDAAESGAAGKGGGDDGDGDGDGDGGAVSARGGDDSVGNDDSDDDGDRATTIYYDDGSRYEGEVDRNGDWHGWGRYFFASGNVFEGQCCNGRLEGVGTLVFANGDRYEGEFLNDKRHGRGRYLAANSDSYDGEYVDGKRHGHGIYRIFDGSVYEGSFVSGKPDGVGTYRFANGDVYSGEFKEDTFHGTGVFDDALGRYEGQFVRGRKSGQGKSTFANGDMYEGSFDDDQMAGMGVYTYSNGDSYVGEFKNGKFDGRGVYTFKDGDKIKGMFADGRPA